MQTHMVHIDAAHLNVRECILELYLSDYMYICRALSFFDCIEYRTRLERGPPGRPNSDESHMSAELKLQSLVAETRNDRRG